MTTGPKPRVKKRNTNRRGRTRRKTGRRRNRRGGSNVTAAYAHMIADPCNSTLLPGIYGDQEGLLARVKGTLTNPGEITQNCGYILWCPDYHSKPTPIGDWGEGPTSFTGDGNLFVWTSDDTAQNPTNSYAFPYGAENLPWTGTADSAGVFPDPASDLLQSDLVQDARTIGSCIRMTYTGAMFQSAGQYAFLEALPLSSVLSGGFGGAPPSVDDMFRLSTKSCRFGTDTIEIIGRPDDLSTTFRDTTSTPIHIGQQGQTEESKTTPLGEAQQPQFFGFAWRGLTTDATSPIVFDLIKSLEWRPAPVSGLTHAPPRSINTTSMIHKATAHLDKVAPGWSTKMFEGANQFAGQLAKSAFTGVGNAIWKEISSPQNLLRDVGYIAPLLLM